MRKIAGVTEEIFTLPAYEAMFSIAKELPRNINNLTTACIICAFAKKLHSIGEEIVYQAASKIEI